MREYVLKDWEPATSDQFDEPASNRFKKMLKLIGYTSVEGITKKQASGMVGQAFRLNPEKKTWWDKYKILTGDYSDDDAELLPFVFEELESVELPEKGSRKKPAILHEELTKLLAEGTPFDEPAPQIVFKDSLFVFTGGFASPGSENDRGSLVRSLGGDFAENLVMKADYLVVGAEGSINWGQKGGGTKIMKAVGWRITHGKPAIVTENHWMKSVKDKLGD